MSSDGSHENLRCRITCVVCCGVMAVTMMDIAKGLNVSVVTVSKALRNKGNLSASTRKRVLKRAKELNYQANLIARSLATRRTYTVGLLLPDFTHPFFAEIAKAIADNLRPHGYHLIISYFEEDPRLERNEAEALLARQVDGLIIASAQSSENMTLFKGIRQRKVPFVLIDRPLVGIQANFVGVDNEAIGRLATAHLVEQGCRRIAHLRGPKVGIAEARLTGYKSVLKKHNLTMPSAYIQEGLYEDGSGYEAMRKLLKMNPRPDGVFCYNDPVAIGAMKAIFEAGLQVPNDIAIVGAGNVHYSDILAVPLTTVDQGTLKIGALAAEILLAQIDSKPTLLPRNVLIEPRLVARKSTQRLS